MASKYQIPIVFKSDKKGIQDAEDGLTRLGNFAAKAGIAIAAGLAIGATAAIAFGVESLKAAAEAEAIGRGMENAVKNAGLFGDSASAIGKATDALDKHSTKLAEMTGIDDEIINQIKTGWLAVPDLAALGTEGINKLAEVTADVAAGTGKDVQAIGLAFTKVAGDTENAFSKLTRAGIVFTDEQKATFDSILETNGEMAAQQYLVEQLGQKYEGAAAAAANPFERLNVIFENLKETIGVALLPAFENVIPVIQDFIAQFVSDPEFQTFLSTMSQTLADMLPRLEPVLDQLGEMMLTLLPGLIPLLDGFAEVVGIASGALQTMHTDNANVFKDLENIVVILTFVNDALAGFNGWLDDTKNSMGGWAPVLKAAFDSVANALFPLKILLQGVADLIRYITGAQAVGGVATNFSTSTNYRALTPFATGGIVTGPTPALVGEAGPEAIIPLDRLDAMVTGNRGGATYNISVNAGMGTDGAALGEQIVNAIRRYERTSGAVFARA